MTMATNYSTLPQDDLIQQIGDFDTHLGSANDGFKDFLNQIGNLNAGIKNVGNSLNANTSNISKGLGDLSNVTRQSAAQLHNLRQSNSSPGTVPSQPFMPDMGDMFGGKFQHPSMSREYQRIDNTSGRGSIGSQMRQSYADDANKNLLQMGHSMNPMSFLQYSMMFGASFPVQMKMAEVMTKPVTDVQQQFEGVKTFGSGFMGIGDSVKGFSSQLQSPFKMYEGLYQSKIMLSSALGGEKQANTAVDNALKMAREYPVKTEEVLSALTRLAVYPEVKPHLQDEKFQKQLMETVSGLSLIVPEQGMQGAMFSLVEAMSGSQRSMQMRFNVSPEVVQSLAGMTKEEMSSDPTKLVGGLHSFISKAVGLDVLEKQKYTFSKQVDNFGDSLQQLTKNVFESTGLYKTATGAATAVQTGFSALGSNKEFINYMGSIMQPYQTKVDSAVAKFTGISVGAYKTMPMSEVVTAMDSNFSNLSMEEIGIRFNDFIDDMGGVQRETSNKITTVIDKQFGAVLSNIGGDIASVASTTFSHMTSGVLGAIGHTFMNNPMDIFKPIAMMAVPLMVMLGGAQGAIALVQKAFEGGHVSNLINKAGNGIQGKSSTQLGDSITLGSLNSAKRANAGNVHTLNSLSNVERVANEEFTTVKPSNYNKFIKTHIDELDKSAKKGVKTTARLAEEQLAEETVSRYGEKNAKNLNKSRKPLNGRTSDAEMNVIMDDMLSGKTGVSKGQITANEKWINTLRENGTSDKTIEDIKRVRALQIVKDQEDTNYRLGGERKVTMADRGAMKEKFQDTNFDYGIIQPHHTQQQAANIQENITDAINNGRKSSSKTAKDFVQGDEITKGDVGRIKKTYEHNSIAEFKSRGLVNTAGDVDVDKVNNFILSDKSKVNKVMKSLKLSIPETEAIAKDGLSIKQFDNLNKIADKTHIEDFENSGLTTKTGKLSVKKISQELKTNPLVAKDVANTLGLNVDEINNGNFKTTHLNKLQNIYEGTNVGEQKAQGLTNASGNLHLGKVNDVLKTSEYHTEGIAKALGLDSKGKSDLITNGLSKDQLNELKRINYNMRLLTDEMSGINFGKPNTTTGMEVTSMNIAGDHIGATQATRNASASLSEINGYDFNKTINPKTANRTARILNKNADALEGVEITLKDPTAIKLNKGEAKVNVLDVINSAEGQQLQKGVRGGAFGHMENQGRGVIANEVFHSILNDGDAYRAIRVGNNGVPNIAEGSYQLSALKGVANVKGFGRELLQNKYVRTAGGILGGAIDPLQMGYEAHDLGNAMGLSPAESMTMGAGAAGITTAASGYLTHKAGLAGLAKSAVGGTMGNVLMATVAAKEIYKSSFIADRDVEERTASYQNEVNGYEGISGDDRNAIGSTYDTLANDSSARRSAGLKGMGGHKQLNGTMIAAGMGAYYVANKYTGGIAGHLLKGLSVGVGAEGVKGLGTDYFGGTGEETEQAKSYKSLVSTYVSGSNYFDNRSKDTTRDIDSLEFQKNSSGLSTAENSKLITSRVIKNKHNANKQTQLDAVKSITDIYASDSENYQGSGNLDKTLAQKNYRHVENATNIASAVPLAFAVAASAPISVPTTVIAGGSAMGGIADYATSDPEKSNYISRLIGDKMGLDESSYSKKEFNKTMKGTTTAKLFNYLKSTEGSSEESSIPAYLGASSVDVQAKTEMNTKLEQAIKDKDSGEVVRITTGTGHTNNAMYDRYKKVLNTVDQNNNDQVETLRQTQIGRMNADPIPYNNEAGMAQQKKSNMGSLVSQSIQSQLMGSVATNKNQQGYFSSIEAETNNKLGIMGISKPLSILSKTKDEYMKDAGVSNISDISTDSPLNSKLVKNGISDLAEVKKYNGKYEQTGAEYASTLSGFSASEKTEISKVGKRNNAESDYKIQNETAFKEASSIFAGDVGKGALSELRKDQSLNKGVNLSGFSGTSKTEINQQLIRRDNSINTLSNLGGNTLQDVVSQVVTRKDATIENLSSDEIDQVKGSSQQKSAGLDKLEPAMKELSTSSRALDSVFNTTKQSVEQKLNNSLEKAGEAVKTFAVGASSAGDFNNNGFSFIDSMKSSISSMRATGDKHINKANVDFFNEATNRTTVGKSAEDGAKTASVLEKNGIGSVQDLVKTDTNGKSKLDLLKDSGQLSDDGANRLSMIASSYQMGQEEKTTASSMAISAAQEQGKIAFSASAMGDQNMKYLSGATGTDWQNRSKLREAGHAELKTAMEGYMKATSPEDKARYAQAISGARGSLSELGENGYQIDAGVGVELSHGVNSKMTNEAIGKTNNSVYKGVLSGTKQELPNVASALGGNANIVQSKDGTYEVQTSAYRTDEKGKVSEINGVQLGAYERNYLAGANGERREQVTDADFQAEKNRVGVFSADSVKSPDLMNAEINATNAALPAPKIEPVGGSGGQCAKNLNTAASDLQQAKSDICETVAPVAELTAQASSVAGNSVSTAKSAVSGTAASIVSNPNISSEASIGATSSGNMSASLGTSDSGNGSMMSGAISFFGQLVDGLNKNPVVIPTAQNESSNYFNV